MSGGCLGGLCGCMSKTMLAIMRFILMLSCIIILLAQLVAIWAMYTIENEVLDEYMPGHHIHFSAYLTIAATAFLASIGIHGAYTKDPKYLKTFAMATLVVAFAYVIFQSDATRNMWEKNKVNFEDQMEVYAREYQWNLKPGQTGDKATRAWDMLQGGLTCCGLTGPKDWPNRWKVTKKDVLPDSCCLVLSRSLSRDFGEPEEPEERKCRLADAYQVGCMERLDAVVEYSYKRQLIAAGTYAILACFALILAKHAEAAASLANSPNAPTTHYQRFQGSVYVRQPGAQPPMNQHPGQPAYAPAYSDGGSLYPSAYGVERVAPPKYTQN